MPAIAQQHDSGEILMMTWMTRAAVAETLATGQTQRLVEFAVDCDGDTLLLRVEQTGVACHAGRRSCFFRAWRGGRLEETLPVEADPQDFYGD